MLLVGTKSKLIVEVLHLLSTDITKAGQIHKQFVLSVEAGGRQTIE